MEDFRIGQGTKDAGDSWDGLIDDFRVYDKALTADEITILYQAAE